MSPESQPTPERDAAPMRPQPEASEQFARWMDVALTKLVARWAALAAPAATQGGGPLRIGRRPGEA